MNTSLPRVTAAARALATAAIVPLASFADCQSSQAGCLGAGQTPNRLEGGSFLPTRGAGAIALGLANCCCTSAPASG